MEGCMVGASLVLIVLYVGREGTREELRAKARL